jgi:cell filamentation protein
MAKYTLNSIEERFQPGSDNKVLINKQGIVDEKVMEELESGLLLILYEKLFIHSSVPAVMTFDMIAEWHRQWLGNIYGWAGRLRNTNLSKDGFQFAAADRIPRLINTFEDHYFTQFEVLDKYDKPELTLYLSECHIEFILIHPFREGNGRLSRLLFDMLSVRAGRGILDYSVWDKHKDFYFKAIQAGVSGNVKPMSRLVGDILPD